MYVDTHSYSHAYIIESNSVDDFSRKGKHDDLIQIMDILNLSI